MENQQHGITESDILVYFYLLNKVYIAESPSSIVGNT